MLKSLKLSGIFLLFFIAASFIHVFCIGYFHHTWSPLMVLRTNEALNTKPEYASLQKYMPLDSISPHLILAVMCAEDQKFPRHNGFDYEAIEKAIEHNKNSEQKIGASTISQQTAKNVFMWTGRNWVRKGFEAYYTVLIEMAWSKKRIIESYLNIIEMGDGIYGAEAAANFYYDKHAYELNKRESAAIAAVLINPRKYNPMNPDRKIRRKIQNILKFMNKYSFLLKELENEGQSTSVDLPKKK